MPCVQLGQYKHVLLPLGLHASQPSWLSSKSCDYIYQSFSILFRGSLVALCFAHGLLFSWERTQRGLTSSCLILEFLVIHHHQEKMFFKEIMLDERQSKLPRPWYFSSHSILIFLVICFVFL